MKILKKAFFILTSSHTLSFCAGILFIISLNFDYSIFSKGLNEWQQLIAGSLALIAAIITVLIMVKHRKEDDYKKNLEARAYMRDALADLSDYSAECFNAVLNDTWKIPDKPTESIGIFKKYFSRVDEITVDTLDDLTSLFQVHNSRLKTYMSSYHAGAISIKKQYGVEKLYEWVLFQCLVNRLFEYARRNSDSICHVEPKYFSNQSMLSALGSLRSNNIVMIARSVPAIVGELEQYINEKHQDS